MVGEAVPSPGPNNCITDVAGLKVGSYTDREALCGCTLALCPSGAVAGVDVRGAAPGTTGRLTCWKAESPWGPWLRSTPWAPQDEAAKNTTIGVVATDAALSKAQCKKVAQMAQDGLARAIRPARTMFDGDTIFALATGERPLPSSPGFFGPPEATAVSEIGRAAADCLSRAIIRAVLAAESLGGWPAFRDLASR